MKKRHEQKLIVLSLALLLVFSLPLVLIFDRPGAWLGIPRFYLSVFVVWAAAVAISFVVIYRHYE